MKSLVLDLLLPGFSLIALLFLASPIRAQGVLTLSPATAGPNGAVTLNLTIASLPGSQPAGVQWTLTYPITNVVSISSIAGASSLAAGASLTCAALPGSYTCVLAGLNDAVIQNGVVAAINLTIAANTTIAVTNTLGTTLAGNSLPMTGLGAVVILPAVSGLSCAPATLNTGGVSTCTVSLTTPATAPGVSVSLSSNTAALTVPASVTVASGGTTATFSATAGTLTNSQMATVTAALNGTQTAAIALSTPGITLTPATASASNLGTQQFTATVTGLSNAAVTWSLSPAIGSISAAGFYSAPQFINSPQTVTVTATSVADPSMSASVPLSLQPVGLVGYWPFDETSGVIAHDASGSGNDGTLECLGNCLPLPAWTTGIRNGALDFPVSDDLVSVSDSPNLRLTNQFTYAFWVNSAGSTNMMYLEKVQGVGTGQGSGASNGFMIAAGSPGNFIYINLYNNSTRAGRCSTANGAVQPQTWQHYAFTYDGANIRIYVNGVLGSVCSTTGSAGTDATPLSIGGVLGGINNVAAARTMDEVRIYNRPLSDQEVASIYNDPGLTGNQTGPGAAVSGLTCVPALLNTGGSSTCTVSLTTPAPAAGISVSLSSNAAALTVPASMSVAFGNSTATFTATAGTLTSSQTATITATLNATQTAAISLVAPAITLTPATASASNLGTLQFTATVTGLSNPAVAWSLNPVIGSISPSGLYSAPQYINSPQSVTVTATSVASPSTSTSVSVSLQPAGLVAYWPFDETSGVTAHDASGSGNDGTLECLSNCSPLPAWTPGMRNGALNFPVTGDFVSVPDSPELRLTNQFTYAFWVNSLGSTNIVYLEKVQGTGTGQGSGASNGFMIATGGPGNFVYINLYNNSTSAGRCETLNGAVQPLTWQHYAITYDGANIRMYVNGVLEALCSATGSAGTDATPLSIGGVIGGINNVTGARTMDEVRIYNRPLSAQEVASIYNDPGLTSSQTSAALAARKPAAALATRLSAAHSVVCSPDLSSVATLRCSVHLAQPAPPAGAAVFLQSSSSRVQLPHQIAIAPGSQSAGFSAQVLAADRDEQPQISASIQGAVATTSALVIGIRPTSVNCPVAPIQTGTWFSCEVRLNSPNIPVAADLVLSSADPAIKLPAVITAELGQTKLTFRVYVAPRTTAGSSKITVRFGATTVSTSVFINAAAAPILNTPSRVDAVFGKPVSFNASAVDPGGSAVELSASGVPAGATFETGTGRFSWTPMQSQQGVYHVALTARNSTAVVAITVDAGRPVITAVQNAASLAPQACSPGSIASLTGRWLASGAVTELGGTRVKVNGAYVPVVYASAARVDFVCPESDPGTVLKISAETEAGITDPLSTSMYATAPGIYSLDDSGAGQGLITLAGAPLLAAGRDYLALGQPAKPGGAITLRATGIAALNGAVPLVTIAGISAPVQSIEASPEVAGVYLITAEVPAGVQEGNSVPVVVSVPGGQQSNQVTIAIERPRL